jgi:hypothetical protein
MNPAAPVMRILFLPSSVILFLWFAPDRSRILVYAPTTSHQNRPSSLCGLSEIPLPENGSGVGCPIVVNSPPLFLPSLFSVLKPDVCPVLKENKLTQVPSPVKMIASEDKNDAKTPAAIDVKELVERVNDDQAALDKIANKDMILFVGTTNAGKTTTICFLSEKPLRVKQESMIDPEGEEILGEEVIDTIDEDEEFKIGHTCDSTTASIHVCALPDSKTVLADSCGFQDTQGSTVDIANAVVLRNAMGLCSSLRPVVVVDFNIISVDKGVPFAQLLGLLLRFFSPIQQFLPSMTFIFTHGAPDMTHDQIMRALSRLSNATHVKREADMKAIVDHLYGYVKRETNRCILRSGDIAAPSPAHVSSRRQDLRELIQSAAPIRKEAISALGCPISNEAQTSLREKCQEIKASIFYHLSVSQYSSILTPLEQLRVLTESVNLGFISQLMSDCCAHLTSHLDHLFQEVDRNLSERRFQALSVTML